MTDTSQQPVSGSSVSPADESGSSAPSTAHSSPEAMVRAPADTPEEAVALHDLISAVAAADPRFRHVSVVHPRTGSGAPVVTTTPLARAMAETQLATNAGAIAETIRTGLPVIVTAADRAARFPVIQAAARRLGVDLQLAVPLLHRTRVVGAFSLYAIDDAEVDLSMLELAEALAAEAAAVLELARTAADLRTAMLSRQRIGQACGILMSRFVLTDEQAFTALSRASQSRNQKVRNLAEEVIATGTLTELEQPS